MPGDTRKLRLVALEMGTVGLALLGWIIALAIITNINYDLVLIDLANCNAEQQAKYEDFGRIFLQMCLTFCILKSIKL